MDFEKIVLDVLASMASGEGKAHSVDMLFTEVLNQHKELIENQNDIRNAISSLIEKGVIIHDAKISNWIKLNK